MQRSARLKSHQYLRPQLSVRPSSPDFRSAHGVDSTTSLQLGNPCESLNPRVMQTANGGHRQSNAQEVGTPTFQHSTSELVNE